MREFGAFHIEYGLVMCYYINATLYKTDKYIKTDDKPSSRYSISNAAFTTIQGDYIQMFAAGSVLIMSIIEVHPHVFRNRRDAKQLVSIFEKRTPESSLKWGRFARNLPNLDKSLKYSLL